MPQLLPPEWIHVLPIVCPLVFLAGLVDAIAGGGGLISLPAYLFTGLPVHLCLGTNKFAMMLGTSFSSIRYLQNKLVHLPVALFAVLAALPGSWLGAQLALLLDARFMKGMMMVVLPVVMVWMWLRRKKPEQVEDTLQDDRRGQGESPEPLKHPVQAIREQQAIHTGDLPSSSGLVHELPNKKDNATKQRLAHLFPKPDLILKSLGIGFAIGAYDGLIGPGTGTFLILAFTTWLGMRTLQASGTAKWVNLASNVAAFAAFVSNGQVLFWVGIPAALCAILGNLAGAHLAIKNGNRIIRPMMGAVMLLLLIKLGTDLFGG